MRLRQARGTGHRCCAGYLLHSWLVRSVSNLVNGCGRPVATSKATPRAPIRRRAYKLSATNGNGLARRACRIARRVRIELVRQVRIPLETAIEIIHWRISRRYAQVTVGEGAAFIVLVIRIRSEQERLVVAWHAHCWRPLLHSVVGV